MPLFSSAHHLPNEDGEFYQFCYVTRNGQIRGASTPFQFKEPGAFEFVEIEDDENDILIVTSKTLALQTELERVKDLNDDLEKVVFLDYDVIDILITLLKIF